MRKIVLFSLFFITAVNVITAKDSKDKEYSLTVTQNDVFLLVSDEYKDSVIPDYYSLYVKKSGDIKSIGLYIVDNNYADPDSYIMRTKKVNPVLNGEIRYVNGKKFIERMKENPNSIFTSTVTNHPVFGECFHLIVPLEMYYGYVIQQQNECTFENGMTVNIRTYSEKGLDPFSKYQNNMVKLIVSDLQAETTFATVSALTDGSVTHIIAPQELTEKLIEETETLKNKSPVQIVFAVDATASMKDDFVELRKNWLPLFEKQFKEFSQIEAGIVFYKDYGDELRTKRLPAKVIKFTDSFSSFARQIRNIDVKGGGDEEEAVYEALYLCASEFEWKDNACKKIILIGDAGAHSDSNPAFLFNQSDVLNMITSRKINVDCFLICDKTDEKNGVLKSVKKASVSSALRESVEEINAK